MIPEAPPLFNRLLQAASSNPSELGRLLGTSWQVPTGYPHWDKLRRLPPPESLTPEQWWLVLKVKRTSNRQPVPLQDKAGGSFSFSLIPEIFEALHHIDQQCAGNIAMPEQVTTQSNRAA